MRARGVEGGGQDCEVARLLPFEVVQHCKVRNINQHLLLLSEGVFLSASHYLHYIMLIRVDVHSLLMGFTVVATSE